MKMFIEAMKLYDKFHRRLVLYASCLDCIPGIITSVPMTQKMKKFIFINHFLFSWN